MTFQDCCARCIENKELVHEFNRLTGHQLLAKRTGIEAAIDKACGHDPDNEAIPAFVSFIYSCVWVPLTIGCH